MQRRLHLSACGTVWEMPSAISPKSSVRIAPHFRSKFIEYPITVTEIDVEGFDGRLLYHEDVGKLAKVRPCAEEYGGKTYMGIFLGDIPHSPHISHNHETGVLKIGPYCNPAIFVPTLNRVIFGMESWWSIVRDEKDLDRDITDKLINNQWYVRMLKLMDSADAVSQEKEGVINGNSN